MSAIFAWWGGSAAVITALGMYLGVATTGHVLGLLIDSRGRYSLTHFQVSLWTIVILSLLAGVFFGRWQHNLDPLGFSIPSVVLGLLGISVGSAVTVTAAKTAKDTKYPASVAASASAPWQPSLMQIFLLEDGTYADQVIDITKFQNFLITLVLVLGYIGLAVHTVTTAGVAAKVTALPGFAGTFLVLLGISHAGYLAGKLPAPDGQPAGLTVKSRNVVSWAAAQSAAAPGQPVARQPRVLRRRGAVWRNGANVNVWSDNASPSQVPAGKPLVVTGTGPFVLHWTTNNWQPPVHDDTAVPTGNGQFAVMLTPHELGQAAEVQFTRRYLDQPAGPAQNGGWEGTPADNHVVRLLR